MTDHVHTYDEVLAVIEAAVARTPDALNPTNPETGGCVNTGADGSHCIAAQVLVDLGYEDGLRHAYYAASVNPTLVDANLVHRFADDARELLVEAQLTFDAATKNGDDWSAALSNLLDHA